MSEAPSQSGPERASTGPLLRTEGLTKHFRIGGALSRRTLHAVDDVSLAIGEREIVALAVPEDDRVWVPQAPRVWFRPLMLNTVNGGWANLLKVTKSGVLSRHRAEQIVLFAVWWRHPGCRAHRSYLQSSSREILPGWGFRDSL